MRKGGTPLMTTEQAMHLRATSEQRAASGTSSDITRWMVVDLAMQTGLRAGELALLTWGDISLRWSSISAQRLKKRGGPRRDGVPMTPSLAEHLEAYQRWVVGRTGAIDPAAPVFLGERGPLSKRGIQQAWDRAIELAGVPRACTIHSARKTLATMTYRETRDIYLVCKQLGHESVKTTMKYAVPTEEDVAKAVTKVFA